MLNGTPAPSDYDWPEALRQEFRAAGRNGWGPDLEMAHRRQHEQIQDLTPLA